MHIDREAREKGRDRQRVSCSLDWLEAHYIADRLLILLLLSLHTWITGNLEAHPALICEYVNVDLPDNA